MLFDIGARGEWRFEYYCDDCRNCDGTHTMAFGFVIERRVDARDEEEALEIVLEILIDIYEENSGFDFDESDQFGDFDEWEGVIWDQVPWVRRVHDARILEEQGHPTLFPLEGV